MDSHCCQVKSLPRDVGNFNPFEQKQPPLSELFNPDPHLPRAWGSPAQPCSIPIQSWQGHPESRAASQLSLSRSRSASHSPQTRLPLQSPLGSQNPQKMQMAFTVIIPNKLCFNSVLIKRGENMPS